jgi:hypothetical protein
MIMVSSPYVRVRWSVGGSPDSEPLVLSDLVAGIEDRATSAEQRRFGSVGWIVAKPKP